MLAYIWLLVTVLGKIVRKRMLREESANWHAEMKVNREFLKNSES